jgi:cell wall-associated NlpC family hydrolase
MRSAGPVTTAAGLVVVLPVVVATVLTAGASRPADAAIGGLGQGLKAGTVPAQYVALVEQAGALCAAAPPSVIAGQIEQESGWNPQTVSPAGAQGISQFMPGTWPTWSRPGESAFDPVAAIPALARYDCALANQVRGWQADGRLPAGIDITELMLAAYNAGAGAVLGARGVPDNGETPGYVTAILAAAARFSDGTGVPGAGTFASREIAAAQAELGTPYAWGSGNYTGPTGGGFDCSGLVMFAVYQASAGTIQLSHFADTQTRGGTPVSRDAMQPGDLISFTDPGQAVAHHIGIYLGDGQMLDAPETGGVVRVDALSNAYWQTQQWRVVRYG